MKPSADMSAFYEFIREKLQVEVSKSQISDKVRRLKKKYLTNVKDREEPVFSKGQDFLVFEHSKRIWGAPGTSNGGVKENVNNSTNGKATKTVDVKKSSEPKENGEEPETIPPIEKIPITKKTVQTHRNLNLLLISKAKMGQEDSNSK
ncbi:hypothetical protein KY290_031843 [Solanum tuberosum]|uniref:Glabrous enhancer-binding protein-like DBD domain-containing protein n=1 Tax=Solanum tuberosum TaxID=4113 RepID=A0ABQ7UAF5_SOLTU|nr:hypothetical protein KY289_031249 [Solanum tuberosum]KAH0743850.1 hypothetical protein KY290_031843 [Solanum tuberosum]